MALEDALVKNERTYIDLSCGTENLSPYSNTSGYSEQSSFYHNDYDWHQQQQRQHHHYHEQQQQQQQQQSHALQTPQLTDLSSRQYYSSFQETHELPSAIGTFPAFSQHALHQADFYNPVLWPSGQSDHIPASSLTTPPRLFSGIDVSQHVVVSGPQGGHQLQSPSHAKPKRKRVQSFNQRKAANVRERRRMFHLNEAFDVLRKRLPAFNYEKRLSRIETLRLAMTYISFMKDVSVGEDPKGIKLKPHGLDLGDPGMMDSLLGHNSSLSSIDNQDLGSLSNDYSESSNDEMTLQNGVH